MAQKWLEPANAPILSTCIIGSTASDFAVTEHGATCATSRPPLALKLWQRRMPTNDSPPGWGADQLSKFWDDARSNQFATFINKRAIYHRLVDIDGAFAVISKEWTNPPSEVAAMLFLRCHSAF